MVTCAADMAVKLWDFNRFDHFFTIFEKITFGNRRQTSFYSRPLKITGTSVSSQKENKERWGIILNHLIVNKPPDVSSKPTEKRGLPETSALSGARRKSF